MKIFLSLLAWIIASAVHAQTTSPLKDFNNGCGSGWNRPIVPDSIGLLCVDYKKACANHDNCYSRCLPGGATYGLPVCSLTMQDKRAGRRLSCDNKFEDDMDEQCNQCDVIRKRVCKGIASIYRIAVRTGGGGSFNGYVIPKDFLMFLQSEEGAKFDFKSFEDELLKVSMIPGITKTNRVEILMKDGTPIARFVAIAPVRAANQKITRVPNVLETTGLHYGSVDISEAVINSHAISSGDLLKLDVLNNQDIQKIKSIKSYQLVAPGK